MQLLQKVLFAPKGGACLEIACPSRFVEIS